jgi:hypothetical protein
MLQRRLRGSRVSDLADEFGRDKASISRISRALLLSIHSRWNHLLEWSALEQRANVARMEEYRAAVRDKGCPQVTM